MDTNPQIAFSRSSWLSDPGKKKIIFIASGIVLVLIFITVLLFINTASNEETGQANQSKEGLFGFGDDSAQQKAQEENISSNTLVYGAWLGNESVIRAQDLQSGERYTLATLPQNVKHVKILDDDHLLYINDTDGYDRGSSINLYTISQNDSEIIYEAQGGLGIDDYVISPNKQYLAAWEAANGPTQQLADGRSAVYTMRLSDKGVKHQIYNQSGLSEPYYYPRGITNNGDVFMDGFLPNVGSGWAKGMTVSNFLGTQKEYLENMAAGTYGTQPNLSPDGRYFAFAGYDPANDPNPGNLLARSIIRPNTIELLDVRSRQRIKLNNLSGASIYSSVSWDKTSGKVLYMAMSVEDAASGWFLYNNGDEISSKLTTDGGTYVVALTGNKQLFGVVDESSSVLGNLGTVYAPPVQNFYTIDQNGKAEDVKTVDSMMQYIAITPSGYFTDAVSSTASIQSVDAKAEQDGQPTNNCGALDSLQLCPFFFKVNLAALRLAEQANPVFGISLPSSPISFTPSSNTPTTNTTSGCLSNSQTQCNPTDLPGCYVTEVARCKEIRAEQSKPTPKSTSAPVSSGTNTGGSNNSNNNNKNSNNNNKGGNNKNGGGNNNKNNGGGGGNNKNNGGNNKSNNNKNKNNKGGSKSNSAGSIAIIQANSPGTTQEKCDVILDYYARNPTAQVGPTFGSGGIDGVGQCYGSPLYLYGTPGQRTHVAIGTAISNAVPSAKANTFDVLLGENGIMHVNGGPFESIAYDYVPVLKRIRDPEKGTIVAKKDVPKVMAYYAKRLGLNEKETDDLVAYGVEQVISPYAFISFFDHETSQKILPIVFSPQPDNYRNIVIFIRLLKAKPPFSIPEPDFPPPLDRSGFTAVEVSGIVR